MKTLVVLLAFLALPYSVAGAGTTWATYTYGDFLSDDGPSQSFRDGMVIGQMQALSAPFVGAEPGRPINPDCTMSPGAVIAVLRSTPPIEPVHQTLAVAVLAAMKRLCASQ
jgi:hypothetical protein